MHERGLHVDAKNDAKPDQIDAEMLGSGPQQRNDDESELEKVEEESQHKHEGVYEDKETNLAAGQRHEQMLDPNMSAYTIKGQRKYSCSDQDEDNEGGKLSGRFNCLADKIPC